MNLIQAIIMGLMQGLTEFLPVSSSGHLVLTSSLYKYFTHKDFVTGGSEEVVFDIVLHLGTLLAVCIFFKDDIIKITKANLTFFISNFIFFIITPIFRN